MTLENRRKTKMDAKEEILLEGEVNVTKHTNAKGEVTYSVQFGTSGAYGDYTVNYHQADVSLSVDPHVSPGVDVWCRDSAGLAISPMSEPVENCVYIRLFPGGQKPDNQEWY